MKIYNVGLDSISKYDLEKLDEESYEYFIYNYRDFGYDGDGAAVLKDKNGKFILIDLGHCSCYGPLEERNPKCIYSLEEITKLVDKLYMAVSMSKMLLKSLKSWRASL